MNVESDGRNVMTVTATCDLDGGRRGFSKHSQPASPAQRSQKVRGRIGRSILYAQRRMVVRPDAASDLVQLHASAD